MISTLTGNSDSVIENKDNVSIIKSARLLCENVYNVAHGQIVFIGEANGRAVVTVKCNPSEILRYGNLKEINCAINYFADKGAQIGIADEYVEFEYCTLWKGQSNYPVRVGSTTYYKQDPTEILEGLYVVRRDGAQIQGYVRNRHRITEFTDEQKKKFGENVYDKMAAARAKQVKSTLKSRRLLQQIALKNRNVVIEDDSDRGEG